MKRTKDRSQASVPGSSNKSGLVREFSENLDILTVKIKDLRVKDTEPSWFIVKVTFFDQLILMGSVLAIGPRDQAANKTVLCGTMAYNPSDYEKMCFFADVPLIVNIWKKNNIDHSLPGSSIQLNKSSMYKSPSTKSFSSKSSSRLSSKASCPHITDSEIFNISPQSEISCCNIDILPLFIDKDAMTVNKKMEPMIKPPTLACKSWDNLPIITMEISVKRNKDNESHHKELKQANYMKITLIGAFNLLIPYNYDCIYTADSKMPISNNTSNTTLVVFNLGSEKSETFNELNFYPRWESLKTGDDVFVKGDKKFVCKIEDVQNEAEIDLNYYFQEFPTEYFTIWGSFHRILMLKEATDAFRNQILHYRWPFEIRIQGEFENHSFMASLNLFDLLYPGETTLRLVVPLEWANSQEMQKRCGCELLLSNNENVPSKTPSPKQKRSPDETICSSLTMKPTGADENTAFILIEVKLGKPLVKVTLPPFISKTEIKEMLEETGRAGPSKRECTGRGQLDRDWQSTVRSASNSLRRVPYHGMTEFCAFNRQLSETRTRVELTTSCWLDAAVFVNNNFVVQDFLISDDTFEEMLMMSHACLMRTACETLVGVEDPELNPVIRAARHARQMQDTTHAVELYLQYVSDNPRCPNGWRELATCGIDVDREWANVCINKAVVLNPRNPLSLLAKGCMVFEENPEAAEPFFVALLALHPFWATAWVATNAYYIERELFHIADHIMKCHEKMLSENFSLDIGKLRTWSHELGDWWDYTPLLPGMSPYYDAADLLLRLRAISLAEVCLSRALIEAGESAAYFHLLALCCRLRGNFQDALCHIQTGIERFGEISYLRSLEAECYHHQNNVKAALASFEKAGSSLGNFSIMLSLPCWDSQRVRSLLVDLIRRHPNAYTWMALADDWITRAAMGEGGDGGFTDEQVTAKTCAIACAVQALKWDRRAGRAWALLSRLVKPSARRLFCRNMASQCGYEVLISELKMETETDSKQSLCYELNKNLLGCKCFMCENLKF